LSFLKISKYKKNNKKYMDKGDPGEKNHIEKKKKIHRNQ
jgi:hypothetical protein